MLLTYSCRFAVNEKRKKCVIIGIMRPMHNIKMQNLNNFFAQSHARLFRRVVLSLTNILSSISKLIRCDPRILIFIIIYYLEEKQRKNQVQIFVKVFVFRKVIFFNTIMFIMYLDAFDVMLFKKKFFQFKIVSDILRLHAIVEIRVAQLAFAMP